MALQLSPESQARITEIIEIGDYPDAEAVVDRALELLAEQVRLGRLRDLIAVGTEQAKRGEVVEYNEQFREESRRAALEQYKSGETSDPDVRP